MKARISCLRARSDAGEESLEGEVQSSEHILQNLGVDVAIFGPHFFDGRELRALRRLSDVHTVLSPSLTPLLKTSVVEFLAAAQSELHHLLLLRSRL